MEHCSASSGQGYVTWDPPQSVDGVVRLPVRDRVQGVLGGIGVGAVGNQRIPSQNSVGVNHGGYGEENAECEWIKSNVLREITAGICRNNERIFYCRSQVN